METTPSMPVITRILEKSQTNSAPKWINAQFVLKELLHKPRQLGVSVRRVPNQRSTSERARWLAELAEALEQAQRLAWLVGQESGGEAMELYGRLESVRLEVQSLQLGRLKASGDEASADWTRGFPWRSNRDNP